MFGVAVVRRNSYPAMPISDYALSYQKTHDNGNELKANNRHTKNTIFQ